MRRLLFAYPALILLTAPSVLAASGQAGSAPLFNMGGGGRALSMGGANVALTQDAAAVFWNCAALAALPERTLSLMYLPLPEGSNYNFAALGWPTLDYGAVGLAAFLITTGDIQRRDENGKLLGEFDANQQLYLLGYGKDITSYLSLGVAVKLFGHNIDDYSAFGAGGDMGLRLCATENVIFGLNAQNVLTPKLTLGVAEESLPRTYRAGVGVTLPFASGRHRLSVEADVQRTEGLDPVLHFGGELALLGSYFLRAGYDVDQVSLGAGVRYRMVAVSYNYRTEDFFDPQHRLSLDISLGGAVESARAEREGERREAAQQLAREQRQRDLREAMTQARYFFHNGLYDSAEFYYEAVSALSGGQDQESIEKLAELESQRSERLSAAVRADVLAEVDSLEAEELFRQTRLALEEEDMRLANWLLGRLRSSYAADSRFQTLEAEYGAGTSNEISQLQQRANRLLDDGDYAAAAILYDQALRLNPNDLNAKRQLETLSKRMNALRLLRDGVAAAEEGDRASAKETLEKVLEITPDDTVAQELHRRISSEPDAVPPSSLADIQADDSTWKLYLDGIERFRQGDYQGAIEQWERVLRKFPGNEETKKNIEQAKLRLQSEPVSDE